MSTHRFFVAGIAVSLLLIAVAGRRPAHAQAPVPVSPFPVSPLPASPQAASPTAVSVADERKAFDEGRAFAKMVKLWDKPLDWNENNASLANAVAHIKKSLGPEAPAIEIRGRDSNHSTFALEQAPLGPTLSSLANLADLKVWAFPGRIVLAPREELTAAELAQIKNRTAGEWQGTRGGRLWSASALEEHAALTLVTREVQSLVARKTKPDANATPPQENPPATRRHGIDFDRPAYEVQFSELTPSSQNMVKELLRLHSPFAQDRAPDIDPATLIGFDDINDEHGHQVRFSVANLHQGRRLPVQGWTTTLPSP